MLKSLVDNQFYKKVTPFWVAIAVITIIGVLFRIFCCYWGYPVPLHPDEPTIVEESINMLSRHSWEAYVYNRPDQFEIKCNAILFTVISWVKYHVPAYVAFQTHEMTFYLIARFFSTACGTLLIPLTAILIEKITKDMSMNLSIHTKSAQISGAFLVAFSTIFIEHSAYATPDIPLTFLIAVFTWLFLSYLDEVKFEIFVKSCIVIGIGITIKYPAAILCIPLAFMVLYYAIVIAKQPSIIFKYAIVSVLIIGATIFIIAPNLYADIDNVYATLLTEARSIHLGADGLGFWGNFHYYLKTAIGNLGYESIVLACIGGYSLIKSKQQSFQIYTFGIGIVFWFCLSTLPLHWVRWGIPIYYFYILIVAVGIGFVTDFFTTFKKEFCVYGKNIYRLLAFLFTMFVLLNTFISGCAITKSKLLCDTRISSKKFCDYSCITKNNTLYESFTLFAPRFVSHNQVLKFFDLTKTGIRLKKDFESKKYLMFSDVFRNCFFAEPERYTSAIAVFTEIDNKYKLLHKEVPDGNYMQRPEMIDNIFYSFQYLFSHINTTGSTIYIYKLK